VKRRAFGTLFKGIIPEKIGRRGFRTTYKSIFKPWNSPKRSEKVVKKEQP